MCDEMKKYETTLFYIVFIVQKIFFYFNPNATADLL